MTDDAKRRAKADADRVVAAFEKWFRDNSSFGAFVPVRLPPMFWKMLTEMIYEELLPHLSYEGDIVGKLMKLNEAANVREEKLNALMAALAKLKDQKVILVPAPPPKP